jgi:hypothetical protein
MATLEQRVKDALTDVSTELNLAASKRGDLTSLTTAAKTNLVVAINEVNSAIAAASGINDAQTGTGTTWSSQKIVDEVLAAKNEILGGASAAFDTLLEIQTAIESNDGEIGSLLTAINERVSVNAAQGLTAPQKQNARDNIDVYSKAEIGNPDADLVAHFQSGLA